MKIRLTLMATSIVILLAGCATVIEEDGKGNVTRKITSYGFLRDASYKGIDKDGKPVELTTRSVTSDVLLGFDKLLGTTAGIAEKLKP